MHCMPTSKLGLHLCLHACQSSVLRSRHHCEDKGSAIQRRLLRCAVPHAVSVFLFDGGQGVVQFNGLESLLMQTSHVLSACLQLGRVVASNQAELYKGLQVSTPGLRKHMSLGSFTVSKLVSSRNRLLEWSSNSLQRHRGRQKGWPWGVCMGSGVREAWISHRDSIKSSSLDKFGYGPLPL